MKFKERDELRPAFMKAVMELTGPGIWTDFIFNHFKVSELHDTNTTSNSTFDTWQVFANFKNPVKVSYILILPITSFSPGVGHIGSGSTEDRLAYVSHGSIGSLLRPTHMETKSLLTYAQTLGNTMSGS